MDYNQTQLVILAAGMGSRFGGLKQMAPMGLNGDWLLTFSLHDAYWAGVRRLVFIIREHMHEDFERLLLQRLKPFFEVRVVYQKSETLPGNLGDIIRPRDKPWGTAHAIWCAKEAIDSPFMVINADDYYGKNAFKVLMDSMNVHFKATSPLEACLLGFPLEKTLSENGGVSRGICQVNQGGHLTHIVERTGIQANFRDEDGQQLDRGVPVSMNIWGFTPHWLDYLGHYIEGVFLSAALSDLPKLECYLPTAVCKAVVEQGALVYLSRALDSWHGVTYKEDHEATSIALQGLQGAGDYPKVFFDSGLLDSEAEAEVISKIN